MENFFGKLIYNFVLFFNGFTKTLIPLSFTIFFFAYREQKDVAYSLFKIRKSVKNTYITFLLLTLFLFIANIYIIPDNNNLLSLGNIVCFIIDVLWLVNAMFAYKTILNNINIKKTFEKSLKTISLSFQRLDQLYQSMNGNDLSTNHIIAKSVKKEVNEISVNAEILFQIMISKKKYNLTNDFSNSLDLLTEKLLTKISSINNDPSHFSFIVPFSGKEYSNLYSVIQKGIIDLMEVALDMKNPKDIRLLIENFTSIKPSIFFFDDEINRFWKVHAATRTSLDIHFKKMYDEYYFSSFRMINKLYEKNDNRAILILRDLVTYDKQTAIYATDNDLLTLIASLIINSIENNNLKQLTDIVNVMLDYLEERKNVVKSAVPTMNLRIKTNVIDNKIKETSLINEVEYKIFRFTFLSIVKAIELGRYNCAGFLIKVSVKNFNQKNYVNEIMQILRRKEETKPNLELSKNLTSILPINYTFSKSSFEYCLMKAVLLIYYQQIYTTRNKRINSINEQDYLEIDRIFERNIDYLQYLNEKINGLNKEYGLIFLKESIFKEVLVEK